MSIPVSWVVGLMAALEPSSPYKGTYEKTAEAIARVAERVRRGGHDVPTDVIRRRFESGLRNLHTIYLPLVDSWQVYDSATRVGPRLIAARVAGQEPAIVEPGAWAMLERFR